MFDLASIDFISINCFFLKNKIRMIKNCILIFEVYTTYFIIKYAFMYYSFYV